jgi:hypothetical protein
MAMIERIFKAVNRKVGGKTTTVIKEGKDGTGLTLPYHCGFCKEGDVVKAAFRTQRERNQHTQRCPA